METPYVLSNFPTPCQSWNFSQTMANAKRIGGSNGPSSLLTYRTKLGALCVAWAESVGPTRRWKEKTMNGH